MNNFFYEYKEKKVVRVDLAEGEKLPLKGKRIDSLLKDDKKFSKQEVFLITKQLLCILNEMRSVFPPVVHKNISPSCIIIKKGWEIALIGFNKKNSNKNYIAPEALTYPTPKSDLYSVGKILIVLSNNNIGDNFKKFTDIMIQANPDNRFKDIKTAQLIFEKIENNIISDNDWYTFNNKASDTTPYMYAYDPEEALHNEFEANLKDLDTIKYRRGHYQHRRGSKYDMFAWLFAVPLIIFLSYLGKNFDFDDDCPTAPTGYYNDEDCNLHQKSAKEQKRDIMERNKKDKERREKWKKSGLTGKR